MKKRLMTFLLATSMVSALLTGCGEREVVDNTISDDSANMVSINEVESILYSPDLGDVKVTLADYKQMDLSGIEKQTVTDEDINLQIASILDYYAQATYLESGIVEDGSIVYISFNGYIDGQLIEGASTTGYELTIGSNEMIPGFESGLIGHNVGDTFELDLRFPDDYYYTEYQGKDVKFDVTIINLVSYEAPEWNDEFVAKNLEYSSTKEYEEFLRQDMENYYNGAYIEQVNAVLVQYLIENSIVENIPQEEIDTYYNDGVNYYKQIAESYGYAFEDFVVDYMGYPDMASFEEEFKSSAIDDLKYKYITFAIAKEKGYNLTQSIFDNFLSQMSQYYGTTQEELTANLGDSELTALYESALCNYTISQVLDDLGTGATEYTQRLLNN
jgi:trigger factor